MLKGSVFVTGGAGFLGKGIIARATREGWPCTFSVYSRDPLKHQVLKREYPHVRCILGDVRDYERLALAMAGHETVIHAGALKHIVEAEVNPIECFEINTQGSLNVGRAAIATGVLDVVGISTDKVCHSINAYGMAKALMERVFVSLNEQGSTRFHLVRYGNVVGSTGSVITEWRRMAKEQGYVTATDPDMTRFWLTVDQAVDLILNSLERPAGTILIPRLSAAYMRDLREWFLPGVEFRYTGLRPGEKMCEELLTSEEALRVNMLDRGYLLWSSKYGNDNKSMARAYVSDDPEHWLTRDEFAAMVGIE